MKLIYTFLIGVGLTLITFSSQAQKICITETMFQEAAKANPQLIEDRNAYEKEFDAYVKKSPR